MDLDDLYVDSVPKHQHHCTDIRSTQTNNHSTHPKLLQAGDGLCGVAGEEVVEQAEAGEGVVDPVEDAGLQLLDHVPLQVQRCDRPKVAQLSAAKVPEAFLMRNTCSMIVTIRG